MKPHAFVLAMLCGCVSFASELRVQATATGLELTPADGASKVSLALGPLNDVLLNGPVVYAALAAGGVAVVNVENPKTPVVEGQIAEGRRISQILFSKGKLLLLELRHEVLAYDVTNALLPVATSLQAPMVQKASAEAPAPVIRQARVLEVVQGRVVLDAGLNAGFLPGKRVKIVSQRPVSKPDLLSGGTKLQPSNETTAVLTLEHSEDTRSMSVLGRGDGAAKGDLAELTEEALSERIFLPRRSPFTTRLGFHVRPFLGLDTVSAKPVGFLADVYGAYYFEGVPFQVEVSVSPFGTVFGGADPHNPVTFATTVAYTTDYFEIGLGAGGLGGRAGPCFETPWTARTCEVNTGFTVNQVLRLGALDGLNFSWRSSIFSRPERFVFGVGRGEINIPLTSRLGLFGGGGGGENGWNLGEVGVRSYVGGTGARGTHVLSASLGVASIFDGPSNEIVTGPAVSFGWEWRL